MGWETDELMIIIMTIMQNTQIIITEDHDYYCGCEMSPAFWIRTAASDVPFLVGVCL